MYNNTCVLRHYVNAFTVLALKHFADYTEGAASVSFIWGELGRQMRRNKEYSISSVTNHSRVWRKGAGKRGLRQSLEEMCRKARTTAGFGGKVPEGEDYGRVWRKGAGKCGLRQGLGEGAGKRGLRQSLEERCRKARTTAEIGGKVPESEASSAHARGCVG